MPSKPSRPNVQRPRHLGNDLDRWIGERIRARRQTIGMSQQTLARQLGVARPTIERWEMGINRMSVGQAGEVAAEIGVPPGWLFEGYPGVPLGTAKPRDLDIALQIPDAALVLLAFAKLDANMRVTVMELLAALGAGRVASLDGRGTPLTPPAVEAENAHEFEEQSE